MFFKNYGPFKLNDLIKKCYYVSKNKYQNNLVTSVANLIDARQNELTFFHSIKYLKDLKLSKASYCLIKKTHANHLPKKIMAIYSTDPLLDFIIISKVFFPDACYDNNDFKILSKSQIKNKIKTVSQNLLIGKNVKIGKNVSFGHNTTIKDYCIIGNNVRIGSNCVISNSIINDDTEISDNTIIGKKGFGFKRINNKMIFIPHIGKVLIGKGCFIGSCVTVDRGSFSDTIIDDHSYIDNHVQIAHNAQIGKFCFFAAQSGVAGSTKIGNNCLIGGQSGISGHLNIGNNVYIGGGSGVINDLKDNSKVMGYPASDFRNFVRSKANANRQ